jgi:transmembrane sensor
VSGAFAISPEDRAEQAAIWAVRLAEREALAEQQEELQAWLDADPLNSAALEEITAAWRTMEHYAGATQMMAMREAALSSARRSLRRRERRRSPSEIVWALVAATLLLMVTGAGVWAWLTPRTYETGVGERRVVALSDGSKLSLDGATVVQVRYTSENRQLWLGRGRAKFEVAHNPLRPFSVVAGDKIVVATGTAFSVELVARQVRVVLYEGHVALLEQPRQDAPHPITVRVGQQSAEQLLTPGREMVLADHPVSQQAAQTATVTVTVTAADPVRSLSWEAGMMVFDDEKLGVVVDRMNRYADKPLIIGDAAAANLRISGVFRAGDTEALVQGLAAAFGVQARASPEAITLFKGEGARGAS